jgi:4-aminobutyrate aminotransferase-like enzyme
VLDNCRAVGGYLGERLRAMMAEFPEMGDVRQLGLHVGVEFVKDPATKEPIPAQVAAIREAGMRLGVIFGLGGVRPQVLKIKPPLIVTREEADEILEKLQEAMREVLRR